MNIIKVIVDKVYETCNVCRFSLPSHVLYEPQDNMGMYVCLVAPNKITSIMMTNMIHARPDWCPLELYDGGYERDDPRLSDLFRKESEVE